MRLAERASDAHVAATWSLLFLAHPWPSAHAEPVVKPVGQLDGLAECRSAGGGARQGLYWHRIVVSQPWSMRKILPFAGSCLKLLCTRLTLGYSCAHHFPLIMIDGQATRAWRARVHTAATSKGSGLGVLLLRVGLLRRGGVDLRPTRLRHAVVQALRCTQSSIREGSLCVWSCSYGCIQAGEFLLCIYMYICVHIAPCTGLRMSSQVG